MVERKSQKLFDKRVSKISKSFNIHFKSVVVKTYKARWGCCNTDAVIFLNWKLVLLPKEVIDYVIIHELSHILVPNHSKNFGLLLRNMMKIILKKELVKR